MVHANIGPQYNSWDLSYEVKYELYRKGLLKYHCTVVNKSIRIEILFFELGHFSEGLMFVTIGKKGIFGLSLHKKKF